MRSDINHAHLALEHIAEHGKAVRDFITGMTQEQFLKDQKTIFAVIRCLEVISEASRRLTEDMKARHPDIPWEDVASLGNVYRHEYHRLNLARVWKTAVASVPRILAFAETELQRLPPLSES